MSTEAATARIKEVKAIAKRLEDRTKKMKRVLRLSKEYDTTRSGFSKHLDEFAKLIRELKDI